MDNNDLELPRRNSCRWQPLLWVPEQEGIEGNEEADRLAKQASIEPIRVRSYTWHYREFSNPSEAGKCDKRKT